MPHRHSSIERRQGGGSGRGRITLNYQKARSQVSDDRSQLMGDTFKDFDRTLTDLHDAEATVRLGNQVPHIVVQSVVLPRKNSLERDTPA